MTTLTKRQDSPAWNLGRSLLKSTAVNFGLQAIGGNLRKDNIWQTLLVGVAGGFGDYLGGNTAMGAILGGGNAIINKSHFVGTTAKYALCGAAADMVLRVTEAKAAKPTDTTILNRPIDPYGYLNRKGVNYIHARCTNIKEATFDEAGSADFNLTSDRLESKTLVAAFDLAKRTKSVQAAINTFENKANALFFIETDIKNRNVHGYVESYPRDAKTSYTVTYNTKNWYVNNHSTLYWVVRIVINPDELLTLSEKEQVARLAVTIGHELFIHSKHIETVDLWNGAHYFDAVMKSLEDTGENGDIDHKLYIQGKKPKMKQYLNELSLVASGAGMNLTAYDIKKAVTKHDQEYKHLLYK